MHSCGCQIGKWNIGKTKTDNAKSHIGEKYNSLEIIDFEKNNRKNQRGYIMICKCDCGNITRQIYSDLISGKVISCGCLQKEKASITGSKVGLNNCRNNYDWYFIKNGNKTKCRSGYEVIYANWLMQNSINFEYEDKCFYLGKGKRYTPDFHLLDTDEYVEIKGSYKVNNSHQKENAKIFKEKHLLYILYWDDIVKQCKLPYKAYHTFLRHADKQNIKKEEYLSKMLYFTSKEYD